MKANAIWRGFARAAHKAPNASALHYKEVSWTYQEIEQAAISAAEHMTANGVHAGDRVAFLARNSAAYLVGWLASQFLGAVHVPINFMLQDSEVAYILDHSAPKILYAGAELMPVAEVAVESAKSAMRLETIDTLLDAPGPTDTVDIGQDCGTRTVAQLAYTSGTESAPKGVLLSDIGLVHEYMSCIEAGEYSAEDRVVQALPLYHCAQLHCFMMPSLFLGSSNILLDKADPAEIIQTIEDNQATSFFAPPTVWIGILRNREFDPGRLASLKKGYYGASIMPTEVLRELREKLPGLRLWNFYGQTEIGPLATVLRPEEHGERPSSAGRPVLFVQTRVVDDDMQDVSPGEIGEVVHRSPQLLLGYYRDPQKSAEAFAGGWFHSGDLATIDEQGYMTIVDRKKDMINTGGENVASREVEEVIYTHPAIAEVAVVGLPDDKWIERVCAFVVLKDGAETNEQEIISHTKSLAPFKRPKQVIFIEQLPKNPSGKVLKRELRQSASG